MESWGFFAFILTMLLIVDRTYNSTQKFTEFKRYLHLSILYLSVGILFSFYILFLKDTKAFHEYMACFILEKIMSIDNIFLMVMILNHFSIPSKFQNKIVIYGILGVIILRGCAIWFGISIIENFGWVLYIFGTILIFKGFKALYQKTHKNNEQKNLKLEEIFIYRFLKKKMHINIHINKENNNFIVKKNGKYIVTNSLLALLSIEFVDLVFAIDSIPTILGITQDMYVVYTSNIFAIMGLRSIFFLLKDTIAKYSFIKPALSIVMIFIGTKIILSHFINISAFVTLLILIFILISSFWFYSKKLKKL
ncbi:MAG: TerC/Alx family metal homeostasis membrane protein [Rickettsia sp.]|nr:TerC/Alx family metal homeostasis membrane protein [Rickettsia sp.]